MNGNGNWKIMVNYFEKQSPLILISNYGTRCRFFFGHYLAASSSARAVPATARTRSRSRFISLIWSYCICIYCDSGTVSEIVRLIIPYLCAAVTPARATPGSGSLVARVRAFPRHRQALARISAAHFARIYDLAHFIFSI